MHLQEQRLLWSHHLLPVLPDQLSDASFRPVCLRSTALVCFWPASRRNLLAEVRQLLSSFVCILPEHLGRLRNVRSDFESVLDRVVRCIGGYAEGRIHFRLVQA